METLFQYGRVLYMHCLFRHIIVGGSCLGLQMVFLFVFVQTGFSHDLANIVAFTISAHVNFFASYHFTWYDRKEPTRSVRIYLRRYSKYWAAVSFTALINIGAFFLCRHVVNYMEAGIFASSCAAFVNFATNRNLVFRKVS